MCDGKGRGSEIREVNAAVNNCVTYMYISMLSILVRGLICNASIWMSSKRGSFIVKLGSSSAHLETPTFAVLDR